MIDGCRQPGCHLSFLLLLFFRNDHDDVKQGDDVCAVCTHRPYCRPSEREREGKRRQANCIFSYSLSLSFIERKGEKRVCSLWNEISLNKLLYFSLYILQHLSKKNVATSTENLISNKGEIKKKEIFIKTDGTFFDFLIHWSSSSCLKLFF
jgi:hypothetical protein